MSLAYIIAFQNSIPEEAISNGELVRILIINASLFASPFIFYYLARLFAYLHLKVFMFISLIIFSIIIFLMVDFFILDLVDNYIDFPENFWKENDILDYYEIIKGKFSKPIRISYIFIKLALTILITSLFAKDMDDFLIGSHFLFGYYLPYLSLLLFAIAAIILLFDKSIFSVMSKILTFIGTCLGIILAIRQLKTKNKTENE